jgi:hypothetical protein
LTKGTFGQAGTICYSTEEFKQTEQYKPISHAGPLKRTILMMAHLLTGGFWKKMILLQDHWLALKFWILEELLQPL